MHADTLIAEADEHRAVEGYAGEVSPREAWDALAEDAQAQLIDVRTPPEWAFAGLPELSELQREPILLSWKLYPHYTLNDQFVTALESLGLARDTKLFFLCRTGGRSLDAARAMTEAGYSYCFNIHDGFEGELDGQLHRGTVSGWKSAQLPWRQN